MSPAARARCLRLLAHYEDGKLSLLQLRRLWYAVLTEFID